MKIGDRLHGFAVVDKIYLKELACDVYKMKHEGCGATLVFMDRADDNKTFSITFKTLPSDSTGVFHIIEHSVLCGSEKYPLRDPFVELLKSSLNTFLNAMTFPDKTMYPVSSRNDKDFYNLVGVYLDAVLNPLAMKSPNAFYQEGWHAEACAEGYSYKGVVFNEMKGAYSSADTVSEKNMNEMLYTGTPYEYDSGGYPEEITDLTYEQFCAAHKKFYNPSAAYIFLDGEVRLDEILPLISEYFKGYGKCECNFEISNSALTDATERTVEYEFKESESIKDKNRLSIGYLVGSFDEKEKLIALGIINNSLFSSNESKIKKEILASGLCEDFTVSLNDGIKEASLVFDFINVRDNAERELFDLFYASVARVVAEKIECDELISNINFSEFALREKDYGRCPLGVVLAMAVMESLLYSENPVLTLTYEDSFAFLRSAVGTDYYERILKECVLDNKRRATLIMHPSQELAKKREDKEKEKIKKYIASLGDEGIKALAEANETLAEWQSAQDSEEAMQSIPALSIEDISDKVRATPTSVSRTAGATVISHNMQTGGIVYAEYLFDISDTKKEELAAIAVLATLLANLGTEKRTARQLQRYIKTYLGGLDFKIMTLSKGERDERETKIYFCAEASALETNKDKIVEIVKEVLEKTSFADCAAVKNIIKQTLITTEESFSTSGHSIASIRVGACNDKEGAVREYYAGYEAYLALKYIDENFDEVQSALCEYFVSFLKKITTQNRLTLSIAGMEDGEFAQHLVSSFAEGDGTVPKCTIEPLALRKEGIAVPAQVSFAVSGCNTYTAHCEPTGSFDVARTLVSYEFLWPAIRVKGGAYGAGMRAGINGDVFFYSYRDPNPCGTLAAYGEVTSFLREFADSGADITRYIIGAVGEAEQIKTPRMRASSATARYLRGIDENKENELRKSMLSTDAQELRRIADVIDTAESAAAVCVIGPRTELEKLNLTDGILDI